MDGAYPHRLLYLSRQLNPNACYNTATVNIAVHVSQNSVYSPGPASEDIVRSELESAFLVHSFELFPNRDQRDIVISLA